MQMKKISITLCCMAMLCSFNGKKNNALSNWKIGVQLWTFHKFTLLEAIDKTDSAGLKFAEAYPGQKVSASINKPFNYLLTTAERKVIKNYLLSKKIKIIALGVVDKYYYTKENIEAYFAFAKDMGISFITAEPEWEDLDLFNSLAEKYKIKVAIHDHPKPTSHYWHPDSVVAAVKNRKNIGACADIGHWARNGLDIVDCLKKLNGHVWGLHFKDVKEWDVIASPDVLPGKGICNLPTVLSELKQQHFNGFISIEYEVDPENNTAGVAAYNSFIKNWMQKNN
jgi:sugar phosphate isomerase/epimerase